MRTPNHSSSYLTGRHRRSSSRGAFTLIELLLVLVILGILVTIVAVRFSGRTDDAKFTAAKADIAAIGLALDVYAVDNGQVPSTEEGLAALLQQPNSAQNWRGPYLKRDTVPVDPWGSPYVYRSPGQSNANGYDLASLGPDRREGTDDVANWTTNQ